MRNSVMIENAAAYRALAKRDRERGGNTVRVYATQAAMDAARGGNVGPGTWEHCLAIARHGWSDAVSEAKAQYDYDSRLEFLLIDGGGYVPF